MLTAPGRDPRALRDFLLASTALAWPPLVPEIALRLATEVTPLWHATEGHLAAAGIAPPFWAFAWVGGQALARTLLDEPALVRGRSVVDLASGSGLVAIAAALAGARRVVAVDVDPLAGAAVALNAERNGVSVEVRLEDVLDAVDEPPDWIRDADVLLAGDACYEPALGPRVARFLRARARAGALCLLGDPGRSYLPAEGLAPIARHAVPVQGDVESAAELSTRVFRVEAR
jgi:predicted nicotinamide N-methyase